MEQLYYEFDKHEYYGLVVISRAESDVEANSIKQAAEEYFSVIGGDSIESVLKEAIPSQCSREYAFMKFVYAAKQSDEMVSNVIKQFEDTKSGVLLIDGSLA